jgi:N-acetylglucosamine kinase-like BadF-type ATPase
VSAAPTWAVGVDGGGTRGRAWAAPVDDGAGHGDAGDASDAGRAPAGAAEIDEACNPYAVGAEAAAAALMRVVRSAWERAGAPADGLAQAYVTIGVAGVERPAEREPLRAALVAAGLAAARLDLLGDPWIALEGALPHVAGEERARLLLVAGTGSVAVSLCGDGRRARVGGWGSRVGDEGSGAWLGIEAARATLRAMDGRDPDGPLARAVRVAWGDTPDDVVGRARSAPPSAFAALAPLVLEHADRDPRAAALRALAVTALADLVTTAAAPCAGRPLAIAFTGGVATALADDLRAVLPPELAGCVRPPAGPPVAGAWRLARRRAQADQAGDG